MNKINILYHGNKSGIKLSTINFNIHNYLYLTPVYKYALQYAKGNLNGVTELHVNISTLLNVKFLGIDKLDTKLFYKKTKLYFPSELIILYPYSALWEIIRYDSDGLIKKKFQNKNINGLIMIERKNSELYESYVLFNNKPIVKIEN